MIERGALTTGALVRDACRAGTFFGQTSGLASGFAQANLVVLPAEVAGDFHEFCRRNPKLTATVFDLPLAIEMATEAAAKSDVHKRITLVAGNYLTDPLGGPFDVIFLSNVLHTESEEHVKGLLKKVHDALEPGGHLVIRDMFMAPDRSGPHGAVFSLNMLLNTEGGRCYSEAEVTKFLKEAGFQRLQPIEPGVLFDARKEGPARLLIDQPRQPREAKPKAPEVEKKAPGVEKPALAAPAEAPAAAEAPAVEGAPESAAPAAEGEGAGTSGEGAGDGGTA